MILNIILMKTLQSIKCEVPCAKSNDLRKNSPKLIPEITMHNNLSFILILPQFFGIFPLHGVTSRDYKTMEFKYFSLRFAYSIYCIFGGIVMLTFCCVKFALHGIMLDKTGKIWSSYFDKRIKATTFCSHLNVLCLQYFWSSAVHKYR